MHIPKHFTKHVFGSFLLIAVAILFLHLYMQPRSLSPAHATFINFMLLRSEQANQDILTQRARLLTLYTAFKHERPLSPISREWLLYLAKQYSVSKPNFYRDATWKELLQRVDIVPNSLVIAQAIDESNWGQSHFAQDGNNFFGVWCYTEGCGLVPSKEVKGDFHAVKSYPTPLDSVKDYMSNLNSHGAYHSLWTTRATLRAKNQPITGLALVNSLHSYSERGSDYIGDIHYLITQFDLAKYDALPQPNQAPSPVPVSKPSHSPAIK